MLKDPQSAESIFAKNNRTRSTGDNDKEDEEKEKIGKLGREYTSVSLKFDNLVSSVSAMQKSTVLRNALELEEDSLLELDEQEKEYLEGIMNNQS